MQQQRIEAPTKGVLVDVLPTRVAPAEREGRASLQPVRLDTADEVPSEQLWRAAIRVTREAAELAAELRRQIARETGPRAA